MTAADIAFRLFGTREHEPESRTLAAGPLSVTFQGGNLRTIRFMGHEVLRAVSFLVRDRDWGTCLAEIDDLDIETHGAVFFIRYRARYTAPSGARLDCDMKISANAAGKLVFAADYVADADFETARAGFTVLHPLVGVAGKPVTVTHGDGSIEQSTWPDLIDPWQPFMDMVAITHEVADDIAAETRFEGDVFEMEDQRNWTDGSYKTYVRPLALPWPYMVQKGVAHRQSVTVEIRKGASATAAPATDGPVRLSISETNIRLPEIGIGLTPEHFEDELVVAEVPGKLGIRHVIAHFDATLGHGLRETKDYAYFAAATGLKITLECAIACVRPLDMEFAAIASAVDEAGLRLDTLFVSPSADRQSTPPGSQWPECPPLADIYAAARKAFPGIRLGGGMLSYFTELNRKRVPGDLLDYVSHATCPIVHASDDLSVMQTFEALRSVVKSVRAIYGDKPYRIGPSTIAMRQNPYGSATKDNPALSRIPMANVDPRHNGQFGAAWTLAYAATVASAGLDVLTLSTLAGPFGLIAGSNEPAAEGALRPLAHVIAALAALSGQTLRTVETTRPDAVLGLGTPDTLLLANITPDMQRVVLNDRPQAIDILDGEFQGISASDTFELGAYACARIRL